MKKNKRYPFTEQEDYIILHSFRLMVDDWESISEQLPGRTPKQIRDRYINYLKEGLKNEPWTNEEDEILIKLFKEIGPKWSKMMPDLPGRSSNDIKNRWHKKLYKRFLQYDIISEPQYLAPVVNQNNFNNTNNLNNAIDLNNTVDLNNTNNLNSTINLNNTVEFSNTNNLSLPVNPQAIIESSTTKPKKPRKPRNSSRKNAQKDVSVKSKSTKQKEKSTKQKEKSAKQKEKSAKQQEDLMRQIIDYEMSIINDTNQTIEQLNQTESQNQTQSNQSLFDTDFNIGPAAPNTKINIEGINTSNSTDNINDYIPSPFHDDFNFTQIIEDLNSQNLDFSWI